MSRALRLGRCEVWRWTASREGSAVDTSTEFREFSQYLANTRAFSFMKATSSTFKLKSLLRYFAKQRHLTSVSPLNIGTLSQNIVKTSLPYLRVKLSCVCLMFAYRKKSNDL